MVPILYEDKDIIAVQRSVELESQMSRDFAPNMVSEIHRYLHNPQDTHNHPQGASTAQPPHVGVIHRLDKPVEGIMVHALNQKSAASPSAVSQVGKIKRSYLAVVRGKPADKQGTYVDYLCHCKENSTLKIVDKPDENSKKAVLNYRVLEAINNPKNQEQILSLIDTELLIGRHHQVRVQFVGHTTPLYRDKRYGGGLSTKSTTMAVDRGRKKSSSGDAHRPLVLYARRLAFLHSSTGKIMEFSTVPSSGVFAWFLDRARRLTFQSKCDKCHKEI